MHLKFLYLHAAQPSIPREVMGKTQNISSTFSNVSSIVSMNWLPPENENKTDISYYELTLYGPDTTSTTFEVPTSASPPYMFVLSNENFITANVTAVDLCDQRSEASTTALSTESVDNICYRSSEAATSDLSTEKNDATISASVVEQQNIAVISLTIFLVISVLIAIILAVAVIVTCILWCKSVNNYDVPAKVI